jgi:hypothetical protein
MATSPFANQRERVVGVEVSYSTICADIGAKVGAAAFAQILRPSAMRDDDPARLQCWREQTTLPGHLLAKAIELSRLKPQKCSFETPQ